MNKKQRVTIGAILEINIENRYYVYTQILHNSNCVFFDYKSSKPLDDFSNLVNVPFLFIVAIYNDVITKGHWLKVGKLEVRKEFKALPLKFIQDFQNPGKFELYDPNNGEIIPATKNEIKGLERAAVWDAIHVEDRIRDYYNGVPCLWLRDDFELFKD